MDIIRLAEIGSVIGCTVIQNEPPRTPKMGFGTSDIATYKTILKTLQSRRKKNDEASTSASLRRAETAAKRKTIVYRVDRTRLESKLQISSSNCNHSEQNNVISEEAATAKKIRINGMLNRHRESDGRVMMFTQVTPKTMELSSRLALRAVKQPRPAYKSPNQPSIIAFETRKQIPVEQSAMRESAHRSPSITRTIKNVFSAQKPRNTPASNRPLSSIAQAPTDKFLRKSEQPHQHQYSEVIENLSPNQRVPRYQQIAKEAWLSTPVSVDEKLFKHSACVRLIQTTKLQTNIPVVLVLPIELVFNEFTFWKEDAISPQVHLAWKRLNQVANVVWVVRKPNTLKAINNFCRQMNLQTNPVYLLEKPTPKRGRTSKSYTQSVKTLCVDFRNLFGDLNLPAEDRIRLHFVAVLRQPGRNLCLTDLDTFQYKLPLTRHPHSCLHILKAEAINANTLSSIQPLLFSNNFSHRIQLTTLLETYRQHINNHISQVKPKGLLTLAFKKSDQEPVSIDVEEAILSRIDVLKRDWIPGLSVREKTKSGLINLENPNLDIIAQTVQPPRSIHYLVGDMLKRNYNLLLSAHLQSPAVQQIMPQTTTNLQGFAKSDKRIVLRREVMWESINYTIPTYLLQ